MKGVITKGTGKAAALSNGQVSAGKTGTSENYMDSWFCGITPQLSVAIWFGDPSNTETIPSNVNAADVFHNFMTAALYGQATESFPSAADPSYKPFSNATYHVGSSWSGSSGYNTNSWSNSTGNSGSYGSNANGTGTGGANNYGNDSTGGSTSGTGSGTGAGVGAGTGTSGGTGAGAGTGAGTGAGASNGAAAGGSGNSGGTSTDATGAGSSGA